MNDTFLVASGNLVRDPDVRELGSSGVQVVNFTLAVNRRYRSGNDWKEEVSFLDFEAWDNVGTTVASNLKKGNSVSVVAVPRTNSWSDQDGNKRSKLLFKVEKVSKNLFTGKRSETRGAAPVPAASTPASDNDEIPF